MKKLKSLGAIIVSACLLLSTAICATVSSSATSSMVADIINVNFASGSAANTVTAEGMPVLVDGSGSTAKITPDMVLGQKVATFDSMSGFGYTLPATTLDAIATTGYTVELMLKSTDTSESGYAIGDMYNVAGMGLEINSEHTITYYQKNKQNSNYRQAWYDAADTDGYDENTWMHFVLTCNTSTHHTEMYVNGKSFDYSNQSDTTDYVLDFPSDVDQVLYVGGNAKNGAFAEGMKGSIAFVKMYSHVATSDEAKELYEDNAASLADILCVDYSNGTANELVTDGPALVDGTGATAKLEKDTELDRTVATFDGQSGFGYKMKDTDYAKMASGYTFEALFKFNELPATTNQYGSSVIGCMNEGSGFGLMGTDGDSLQYWFGKKVADGNYRQLWLNGSGSAKVDNAKWLHVMVTYEDGTYNYYVNGVKNDYVTPGELGYLADPANVLYVGGAPNADGSFRIGMKGSVSYVKLYSAAKTADDVAALSANALAAGSSNNTADDSTGAEISTTNSKDEKFEADFDNDNIVIDFAAMSDIHIGQTASSHDTKFVNSLTKAKELAGGSDKLAGVLVAGDIGDAAPLQEYPIVKGYLDSNLDSATTEFLPTIGNHDYYFQGAFSGRNSFKDLLGDYVYKNPLDSNTEAEVTHGNYHTVINGIHFISVFGMDGNHADSDVDWLDEQIALAEKDTPNMPIIVYSHVQAANTVIDDADDLNAADASRWYSTTIGKALEKYSNVVYFAGHTHATADIWNNGSYTAVGTGCIEKDFMNVQVDKKGSVKILVYPTNLDINRMATPLKVWTFATKAYSAPSAGNTNNTTVNTTGTTDTTDTNTLNQNNNTGNVSANDNISELSATGNSIASVIISALTMVASAAFIVLLKKKYNRDMC